jgi:hypothetical protein
MSKSTIDPNNLEGWIRSVSRFAEKQFAMHGEFHPMYHIIDSGGQNQIMPAPPLDKDTANIFIRSYLELIDAQAVLFTDEAWMLEQMVTPGTNEESLERYKREGISNHPDRTEAIIFSAENRERFMLAQRKIVRPQKGKPYLEPLVICNENMEGRLVGLLPPKGRAN